MIARSAASRECDLRAARQPVALDLRAAPGSAWRSRASPTRCSRRSWIISMRSRSAPGIVSSVLAVRTKITLREVERQIEVVVAEAVVLLGVEHLEHRARRVAAEVGAHLVDLVDHQQRVVGAGVAQRPDDRAGQRADVGAPVAADLGLVADAADAERSNLPAQRARDRAPERCLADAGRADEAAGSSPRASGFRDRTARYSRIRSLTCSRS